MSEQQHKIIQSPLTRAEIHQIVTYYGGTIDAIVAIGLDEIIECHDRKEFEDLLEERICPKDCDLYLKYDPSYKYELFGIRKIEQQILIRIQCNINQWLEDFENYQL